MKRTWMAVLAVLFVAAPAFAMGPVDVEVGVKYWFSETDFDIGEASQSFDSEDLSFFGRLWLGDKWGVHAGQHVADVDMGEGGFELKYLNLDVRRKIISPTDNNYLALGAGYQQVEFSEGPDGEDSSGWRVVVEGRVSLAGIVHGYAEAAYMFGMDDIEELQIDGWEAEFGVAIKPVPFLRILAGYRMVTTDLEVDERIPIRARSYGSLEPAGFFVGLSARF